MLALGLSENFVSELELVSDAAKLLHPSLALGDSVFYCVLAVDMLVSHSEIWVFLKAVPIGAKRRD